MRQRLTIMVSHYLSSYYLGTSPFTKSNVIVNPLAIFPPMRYAQVKFTKIHDIAFRKYRKLGKFVIGLKLFL